MGNVSQTNPASLIVQRNLFRINDSLQTVFERLSSGLRINGAEDDPSGLFFANTFTLQIVSINSALRTANDGISVSQTAEGALQEVTDLLQRMRDLAVQAASDVLTDDSDAKEALATEYLELGDEIERIRDQTQFADLNLFDGSRTLLTLQVGMNPADIVDIELVNLNAIASTDLDISTSAGASNALEIIDTDLAFIDGSRAEFGAIQNRLESAITTLTATTTNAQASRSRIRDADFGAETAALAQAQVQQQAAIAILAQANSINDFVLSLLQG